MSGRHGGSPIRMRPWSGSAMVLDDRVGAGEQAQGWGGAFLDKTELPVNAGVLEIPPASVPDKAG